MQAPLVVFDHTKNTLVSIPTGPAADKRLAEVAQANQAAAAGGRPSA
jgi:hypothetical protein